MTTAVDVRPIEPADHDAWAALFAAYREFYETDEDPRSGAGLGLDPGRRSRDERPGRRRRREGRRVRAPPALRPALGGWKGLFLDDLFTVPDLRGQGVGRALIGRLTEIARENGCAKVRWVTADDNVVAQRLYDQIAEKTTWLTYDLLV